MGVFRAMSYIADVSIHFGGGGNGLPPGLSTSHPWLTCLLMVPWLVLSGLGIAWLPKIRRQSTQRDRDRLTYLVVVYLFSCVFVFVMVPPPWGTVFLLLRLCGGGFRAIQNLQAASCSSAWFVSRSNNRKPEMVGRRKVVVTDLGDHTG